MKRVLFMLLLAPTAALGAGRASPRSGSAGGSNTATELVKIYVPLVQMISLGSQEVDLSCAAPSSPGQTLDCSKAVNASQTYSITDNTDSAHPDTISASYQGELSEGLGIELTMGAGAWGTSAGPVQLSQSAQPVVTDISGAVASGIPMKYRLTYTGATPTVPHADYSANVTVVFTITQ